MTNISQEKNVYSGYSVYGLTADIDGNEGYFTLVHPAVIIDKELWHAPIPNWTEADLRKVKPGDEKYLRVTPEELGVFEGQDVALVGTDFLNDVILISSRQEEVKRFLYRVFGWIQYGRFHAHPMNETEYNEVCSALHDSAYAVLEKFNAGVDTEANEVSKAADHVLATLPRAEEPEAYALRKKYYKKTGNKRSYDFLKADEQMSKKYAK